MGLGVMEALLFLSGVALLVATWIRVISYRNYLEKRNKKTY